MTEKQKKWIDSACYENLLYRWRFAPIGDPMFQGDTGDYYAKVMAEKKKEIGATNAVAASKTIGWEK